MIYAYLDGLTIPRSSQNEAAELEKLPSSLAAMFEYIDREAIPIFPLFTAVPKVEQSKLVKTIGQRMREARELRLMIHDRQISLLMAQNSCFSF